MKRLTSSAGHFLQCQIQTWSDDVVKRTISALVGSKSTDGPQYGEDEWVPGGDTICSSCPSVDKDQYFSEEPIVCVYVYTWMQSSSPHIFNVPFY